MENKVLLTIYTATYNRGNLLSRVYESLKRQSSNNFLWQVIDDGSTDNTKELVEYWKRQECLFEIRYCYKENGGIHTVRDLAYEMCDTELIMGVDSDDWLLDDAVKNIEEIWSENNDENVIGIFATTRFTNGKKACASFPSNLDKASCQDFLYKYKLQSDTVNIFKAEIMKSLNKAPIFKGEKLIGEGYKMIQLPDNPFLVRDISLVMVEYQDNGYSMNAHNAVFENPMGFREDYRMHMLKAHYLKPKLRGYLGYIACSLIIKDKSFIFDSDRIAQIILLLPIGVIAYWYLIIRRRMSTKVEKIERW